MANTRQRPTVLKDQVHSQVLEDFLRDHPFDPLSVEYQKLVSSKNEKFLQKKISEGLTEFRNNAEYKNISQLTGFPADDKSINNLADFIVSKLRIIHEAVYIANNSPDVVDQKNEILRECSELFKTLHDYLVSEKILPPVIENENVQLLFWSSELAQHAANAYAKSMSAVTDTTAGTQYIGKIYGYDCLKEIYDDIQFKNLKEFYWHALSNVYASAVKYSSVPPVVYVMDTLTTGNYFHEVELEILRKKEVFIDVKVILKKFEKTTVPSTVPFSDDINECGKSKWCFVSERKREQKINILTLKMSVDLTDKATQQKKGCLTITKEKKTSTLNDGSKVIISSSQELEINLNNQKKTILLKDAKEMLDLFESSWVAEIQLAQSLDRVPHSRRLVKTKKRHKKMSSIPVTGFSRGLSYEMSSPTKSLGSPKLGLAFELPIEHIWLHSYIQYQNSSKQNQPKYGPKCYYERFLQTISHPIVKEKTAVEFINEIAKQIKDIWNIINYDVPANNNSALNEKRVLYYTALCALIEDSLTTIDNLKRMIQSTKEMTELNDVMPSAPTVVLEEKGHAATVMPLTKWSLVKFLFKHDVRLTHEMRHEHITSYFINAKEKLRVAKEKLPSEPPKLCLPPQVKPR